MAPSTTYLRPILCPFDHEDEDFCLISITMYNNVESIIGHLENFHGITVESVDQVVLFLEEYLNGYAKKNPKLSKTLLVSDQGLRESLRGEKLAEVIKAQEIERRESFAYWPCLFCKYKFSSRSEILDHMKEVHSFFIGHSDNLIFLPELLEEIKRRLFRQTECIYCEQTFQDGAKLRRHMRKKKHFKLNPKNKGYDCFYVVNYLEPGQRWRDHRAQSELEDGDDQHETTTAGEDDELNETWSDWDSPSPDMKTNCLFCEYVAADPDMILNCHMPKCHEFNLMTMADERQLSFYDLVKFVNYVRRMNYASKCFTCLEQFESDMGLFAHLTNCSHIQLPDSTHPLWRETQYLLPTYENDPLIMALDSED